MSLLWSSFFPLSPCLLVPLSCLSSSDLGCYSLLYLLYIPSLLPSVCTSLSATEISGTKQTPSRRPGGVYGFDSHIARSLLTAAVSTYLLFFSHHHPILAFCIHCPRPRRPHRSILYTYSPELSPSHILYLIIPVLSNQRRHRPQKLKTRRHVH